MNARKSILSIAITVEHDVVQARQRARQIAELLGFDAQDQTRIATAVSEIARNAFRYARGGKVEFLLDPAAPPSFAIEVTDKGNGIERLDEILDGRYVSATGMGLGMIGAKRLMDHFVVDSSPGRGTKVVMAKRLIGNGVASAMDLSEIVARLATGMPQSAFQEMQQQNQELLRALEALRTQREHLARVNQELEDTNRGVVALYAELDEKADYLQRANEVKTHFLSNMTHEFRTPLNSIMGLSRLLLDRLDGPITAEQEKQIHLIRKSAQDLSDLVNDLLDLAKVEAGKVTVKPHEFELSELFGALRGMLKPLLAANTAVNLIFDEPPAGLILHTDEGKVSQILRNLIANALKFTERGEIRVSARVNDRGAVEFRVADTGIGIAAEDLNRIFEEFTQLDSELHKRSRGSGLGLPLSRRLATLLGGDIRVESEPGVGSVFTAIIPGDYRGPEEAPYLKSDSSRVELDPTRKQVLVIEDNRESLFIYEKYLQDSEFQIVPARTVKEARQLLCEMRPAAVIADILLEAENTWHFISELKSDPTTMNVPLIVITIVDNEKKALFMGADAFHVKPVERSWLLARLAALTTARERVLVIDDDEIARYLIKRLLPAERYDVIEAASGADGLRIAKTSRPRAIILDLLMPEMNGFEFLQQLKADAQTRDIPVVISTSKRLQENEFELLGKDSVAILSKGDADSARTVRAVEEAVRQARHLAPDRSGGAHA